MPEVWGCTAAGQVKWEQEEEKKEGGGGSHCGACCWSGGGPVIAISLGVDHVCGRFMWVLYDREMNVRLRK